MAWYWWALIGPAVVYGAIAILVFLTFTANLLALDMIFDTKATSSAVRPMIIASISWPRTLYDLFRKKGDNEERKDNG